MIFPQAVDGGKKTSMMEIMSRVLKTNLLLVVLTLKS